MFLTGNKWSLFVLIGSRIWNGYRDFVNLINYVQSYMLKGYNPVKYSSLVQNQFFPETSRSLWRTGSFISCKSSQLSSLGYLHIASKMVVRQILSNYMTFHWRFPSLYCITIIFLSSQYRFCNVYEAYDGWTTSPHQNWTPNMVCFQCPFLLCSNVVSSTQNEGRKSKYR